MTGFELVVAGVKNATVLSVATSGPMGVSQGRPLQ